MPSLCLESVHVNLNYKRESRLQVDLNLLFRWLASFQGKEMERSKLERWQCKKCSADRPALKLKGGNEKCRRSLETGLGSRLPSRAIRKEGSTANTLTHWDPCRLLSFRILIHLCCFKVASLQWFITAAGDKYKYLSHWIHWIFTRSKGSNR